MVAGSAKGSQTSNQIIKVAFLEARQIRVKVLGSHREDLGTKILLLCSEAQPKALDNRIIQLSLVGLVARIKHPNLEVLEHQIKLLSQEGSEGLVRQQNQVALEDSRHSLKEDLPTNPKEDSHKITSHNHRVHFNNSLKHSPKMPVVASFKIKAGLNLKEGLRKTNKIIQTKYISKMQTKRTKYELVATHSNLWVLK